MSQELEAKYADPNLFPGSDLDGEAQQVFLVERLAFVTALVLRKLAEAGKVSVQFLSTSIQYQRHPIRDRTRAPDQLNMHRTFEFYEERGTGSRISYGGFANMLIHSRAFVTAEDLDSAGRAFPYSFAVTSDRTHLVELAVFSIEDLRELVSRLIDDDIVQQVVMRDGCGGLLSVGSCKPMDPEELLGYFDRSPYRDAVGEIRQLIADRFA